MYVPFDRAKSALTRKYSRISRQYRHDKSYACTFPLVYWPDHDSLSSPGYPQNNAHLVRTSAFMLYLCSKNMDQVLSGGDIHPGFSSGPEPPWITLTPGRCRGANDCQARHACLCGRNGAPTTSSIRCNRGLPSLAMRLTNNPE